MVSLVVIAGVALAGFALWRGAGPLPDPERYTYVFEGNSQVLDHILVSRALALKVGPVSRYDYDVVHVNSEYTDQVSDHDPQVVRIRP